MKQRSNKTALITGASGGLGADIALVHAYNGGNLVLVARSEDKLERIKEQFTSQYGVEVKILVADLSQPESPQRIYDTLQAEGIEIDYLVNNAGIGDYGDFAASDWSRQQEMIRLNVEALVHMTHLFLPQLIRKGGGRILNVASIASFQPGPTMSVYFATKAFVLSFSEALATELKGRGVTVTALCPGATETGFKDRAAMGKSSLFGKGKTAMSHEVALYGYNSMLRGRRTAVHGTKNKLMVFSVRFVPRCLAALIAKTIMKEKG